MLSPVSITNSPRTFHHPGLRRGSWHLPSWDHLRHTCRGIHLYKGPSLTEPRGLTKLCGILCESCIQIRGRSRGRIPHNSVISVRALGALGSKRANPEWFKKFDRNGKLIAARRGIELRLHLHLEGWPPENSCVCSDTDLPITKPDLANIHAQTLKQKDSESAKPGFSVHEIPTLVQSFPMLNHSQGV